jgi:hypothetical protein
MVLSDLASYLYDFTLKIFPADDTLLVLLKIEGAKIK